MPCNSILDLTNLKVNQLHLKYSDMIMKAKDPVRGNHTFLYKKCNYYVFDHFQSPNQF